MQSEIKVYKLHPVAEKDFKAKSGNFELVLLFKSDGSVHAYHSNGKQVIEPRDGQNTRLHAGKERLKDDGEAKLAAQSPYDKRHNAYREDEFDAMSLDAVAPSHDEDLTEYEEVAPDRAPSPANTENIIAALTPIAYALLKNSCCVCGGGWCIYCS